MNAPASVGEDELVTLKRICNLFTSDEGVQLALVLHRDGQILVSSGNNKDVDLTSMAALSAGILAGAKGMANLVNEQEFLCVFHEGVRQKLLICPIDTSAILMIHFDQRKTLGWIRFQARKHMPDLVSQTKSLMRKFEVASPALASSNDEDFELLHFGNFSNAGGLI